MTRALSYFPKSGSSFLTRWGASVDWGLIVSIVLLSILGLYAVSLTSGAASERLELDEFHFISRQLLWVPLGLVGVVCVSFANQRQIRLFGLVLTLASICLMLWISMSGTEIKGAVRWLRLGGITVQPSEFLKPGLAVVLGAALAAWSEHRLPQPLAITSCLVIVSFALLIMQPDIGQSFLIAIMIAVQAYVAGISVSLLALFCVFLLAIACSVLAFFSLEHVRERITDFWNAGADPTSQISKSLNSIASGGFLGEGPGDGHYKYQLADSHTDFIFAVVAEEHGVLGGLILLIIYLGIAMRVLVRLREQSSLFIHVAGAGLLFQLVIQAWINMASTLNLIPTKGMTLPFVSYGGSSIISVSLTFGLLLSLTRRWADSITYPQEQLQTGQFEIDQSQTSTNSKDTTDALQKGKL